MEEKQDFLDRVDDAQIREFAKKHFTDERGYRYIHTITDCEVPSSFMRVKKIKVGQISFNVSSEYYNLSAFGLCRRDFGDKPYILEPLGEKERELINLEWFKIVNEANRDKKTRKPIRINGQTFAEAYYKAHTENRIDLYTRCVEYFQNKIEEERRVRDYQELKLDCFMEEVGYPFKKDKLVSALDKIMSEDKKAIYPELDTETQEKKPSSVMNSMCEFLSRKYNDDVDGSEGPSM